jgi:hypothetical protein
MNTAYERSLWILQHNPENEPGLAPRAVNDWGVHHLHISSVVQPDGFVTRDGPLLFMIFRPQVAYFIDVMTHKDWNSDHVLGVLVDEWPDEGVIYELRGLLPQERNLTDSDRQTLRNKHVNALFFCRGKVYCPIGMLSTAGTTIAATRDSDLLLRKIENFEADFLKDRKKFEDAFQASKLVLPMCPSFRFAIRENGCGLIEEQTKAWIAL